MVGGRCKKQGALLTGFFFFFLLFGLHWWHMEVPRLGVESKLQLPASTTATAMPDLSRVYDLHHRSQQQQILNPLSEARDQTCVLMDISHFRFCCRATRTPSRLVLISHKMSRSPHPPARISKVCVEPLLGFDLIFNPNVLTTLYSLKAASLKTAPTLGTGRTHIPRTGEG